MGYGNDQPIVKIENPNVTELESQLAQIVTNTDNFSDFQTSADFLKSNNKFVLHFPKSDYNVTSSIQLQDYDYVIIDGNGSTFYADGRIDLFQIYNCKNVIVKNIKYMPVDSTGDIRLLRAESVENGMLFNCKMQNGNLASLRANPLDIAQVTKNFVIELCHCVGGGNAGNLISLQGTENITIRNNYLDNTNFDGIKTASPEAGYKNDNIYIYNNEILNCKDDAIDMYDNGHYLYIEDNYIHKCGKASNLKNSGTTAHASAYKAWFVRNRVEECEIVVNISDSNNITVKDNHFENCGALLSDSTQFKDHLLPIAGASKHITVKDNHFINNKTNSTIINIAGISVYSVFDVSQNTFIGNEVVRGLVSVDVPSVNIDVIVSKNRSMDTICDRFVYCSPIKSNSSLLLKDNVTDKQIRINIESGATGIEVIIENNIIKNKVDPIRVNETGVKLIVQGNSPQLPNYGTTTQRPPLSTVYHYSYKGTQYFDTDLNKLLTWNGAWYDATGTAV